MKQLTWEEFLSLDLVGRDLVNDDRKLCGGLARGPITGIEKGDDCISVTQRWAADLVNPDAPAAEHRWVFLRSPGAVGVNPAFIAPPVQHPDGRIMFLIPFCGLVTILPEGDHLDPKTVESLPADLLAA